MLGCVALPGCRAAGNDRSSARRRKAADKYIICAAQPVWLASHGRRAAWSRRPGRPQLGAGLARTEAEQWDACQHD